MYSINVNPRIHETAEQVWLKCRIALSVKLHFFRPELLH